MLHDIDFSSPEKQGGAEAEAARLSTASIFA